VASHDRQPRAEVDVPVPVHGLFPANHQ
jgi:hypothetical protein